MKLAENQKVFKQLNIDDTLWNDIKKDDNKVLIIYGSNGRGKSTIKDLFQKEKLEKSLDVNQKINLIPYIMYLEIINF